jgi:hypothetical protein
MWGAEEEATPLVRLVPVTVPVGRVACTSTFQR